jgi:hypothetical protein
MFYKLQLLFPKQSLMGKMGNWIKFIYNTFKSKFIIQIKKGKNNRKK